MAYTKQSVENTTQLRRIDFNANAVPFLSTKTGFGRQYVNCSPVPYRSVGSAPKWQVEPRPFFIEGDSIKTNNVFFNGCFTYQDLTDSNIIHHLVIVDGDIYLDGTDTLENISSTTGVCTFCQAEQEIVIVTRAGTATTVELFSMVTEAITDVNVVSGALFVGDPVFLDGYVFFADVANTPGQRIYNTTYGDLTTIDTSNDYIDSEQYPDGLVTLSTHKNHLVALGRNSIEFFYDAGNALGSPLTRNVAYSSSIGCHTVYSGNYYYKPYPTTVKIKDDVYFISSSSSGGLGVHRISNFNVEKVSDTFLDKMLNHMDADYTVGTSAYYPSTAQNIFLSVVYAHNESCILLQWIEGRSTTKPVKYYLFQPSTGIWSEWNFTTSEAQYIYLSNVSSPRSNSLVSVTVYDAALADYGVYMSTMYPQAYGVSDETFISEVNTDYLDFDSYYNKHIHFVDVLGKFDSQHTTISLEVSKDTNQYDYTNAGTKEGTLISSGVARFRNIGRVHRASFRILIQTNAPFVLDGLDVRYEQGLQ